MSISLRHISPFVISMMIIISSSFNSYSQNTVPEKELPLPVVPADLTSPSDRAGFIISHFWDKMDFTNPSLTEDHDFIEQNFVNYINLFPPADQGKLANSLKGFLAASEKDPESAKFIYSLADKYLLTKDSPMRNEGYHILFLENAIASPALGEAGRLRAKYRLESEIKNRPGSEAPDFRFIDREGTSASLTDLNTDGNILLIFYDPDCNHCTETINKIKNLSLSGFFKVVAIDVEEDRQLWDATKNSLPVEWTVGFATDPIQDEETYIFDEMPSLYVLSPEKRIILKDATIPEITNLIKQDSQQPGSPHRR